MDDTTFRILDTLSREVGQPLSINELTNQIRRFHGRAYYANIYRKVRELNKEGVVGQSKAGKSSITALSFRNYLTTVRLTEMELRRTYEILTKESDLRMVVADIERRFSQLPLAKSVAMIHPEKNMRLNRAELLILLQDFANDGGETAAVHNAIQTLRRIHNIKIDYLPVRRDQFFELLKAEERNPLKEMLWNKVVVFRPEAFWTELRVASEERIQIQFEEMETNPAKIIEQELAYNLARFGYKELGVVVRRGQSICIEYTIAAILIQNAARRVDAIPVILAKNRANYNVLIFLCQKYGRLDELLGLLKVLDDIKPTAEVGGAIKTLEIMEAKEVRADKRRIKEMMRVYGVP